MTTQADSGHRLLRKSLDTGHLQVKRTQRGLEASSG